MVYNSSSQIMMYAHCLKGFPELEGSKLLQMTNFLFSSNLNKTFLFLTLDVKSIFSKKKVHVHHK